MKRLIGKLIASESELKADKIGQLGDTLRHAEDT